MKNDHIIHTSTDGGGSVMCGGARRAEGVGFLGGPPSDALTRRFLLKVETSLARSSVFSEACGSNHEQDKKGASISDGI